jgi:hypothetical protein
VEKIRSERLKAITRAAENAKAGARMTVTTATVAVLGNVYNMAILDGKTERNPLTRLRFGHLWPGHRQNAVERLVSRSGPMGTAAVDGTE